MPEHREPGRGPETDRASTEADGNTSIEPDTLAGVLCHDLRNPLQVARANLSLAMEECDSDRLAAVDRSLSRMESLVEGLADLQDIGEPVEDPEPVALASVCDRCWDTLDPGEATLLIDTDATVLAERARLQQLVANLLRNAVAHGGGDGRIEVGDLGDLGDLDDATGFYVEDDGPGVPPAERDRVFDLGYSGAEGGSGFGLYIVAEIARAHDWSVSVAEGRAGGARFEIRDVTPVE